MNPTRSLAMAVVAASLAACKPTQQAASPPPPPAVGVQLARMKGVAPSNEFVGRIKAVDTVQLRARVEGFLDKVLFKEGQHVKAGELLYQIEKTQYQAAGRPGERQSRGGAGGGAQRAAPVQSRGGPGENPSGRAVDVGPGPRQPGKREREHPSEQSRVGDRAGKSRLHRRQIADRRPNRADRLHSGKSRQSGQRRSRDDRQRRSDLCRISRQHAPDRRHHGQTQRRGRRRRRHQGVSFDWRTARNIPTRASGTTSAIRSISRPTRSWCARPCPIRNDGWWTAHSSRSRSGRARRRRGW